MTKLNIITTFEGPGAWGPTTWSATAGLIRPHSYGPTEQSAVLALLGRIHDKLDGREHTRAVYLDFVEWTEKRFARSELPNSVKALVDGLYVATFNGASEDELRQYSRGA